MPLVRVDRESSDDVLMGLLDANVHHELDPAHERHRWFSSGLARTGVFASVVLVGALVGCFLGVHLFAQPQAPSTSLWQAEGKAEFFSCDVCKVGQCDRDDPQGPCVWYAPPIDEKGAYHCSVKSCDEVPQEHSDSQSSCWQYEGISYYSIYDKSAPCLFADVQDVSDGDYEEYEEEDVTEEPTTTKRTTLRSTSTRGATTTTKRLTTTTAPTTSPTTAPATKTHTTTKLTTSTHEMTSTSSSLTAAPRARPTASATAAPESTSTSAATTATTQVHEEDSTTAAHRTSKHTEKHPEKHAEKHAEKHPEGHSKKSASKSKVEEPEATEQATAPPQPAPPSSGVGIFSRQAAKIEEEAEVRLPELTAYWDVGTCGPMGEDGDDYHKEWCGGLTEKPDCAPVVHVNYTTCASLKARLAYVSGSGKEGDEARTWIKGCEYMYFAQYECIASTTTTTTVTTTTRSLTSTTATSSTTSATSTTSSSSTSTSSSSSTSTTSSSSSSSTTSGTNTSTFTTSSSSTSSSTNEPGSCPQPVLGQGFDTSDCEGVFPPNGTCVVRCASTYTGGEAEFSCTEDESFIGVAPVCHSTTTTTSSSTLSSTTSSTSSTWKSTTHRLELQLLDTQHDYEWSLRRKSNFSANKSNWTSKAGFPPNCNHKFKVPDPPLLAPDFNGIQVPDVCFEDTGPHYVYVIGDWGGTMTPTGPKPANQRAPHTEVDGVDDQAQQRVAAQMAWRAKHGRAPDYFLNVGDNFYWAGLDIQCGAAPAYQVMPTGQFHWNFEMIYVGEGIEGKPWLSVLGNHDYGGYMYNKGWDQQISYTWSEAGRWMMPAQYWATKVHYPGFSVDYFFLDTNAFEAHDPHADPDHNICSKEHVKTNESGGCGKQGPKDVWDCPGWFQRLWDAQEPWIEKGLSEAVGDWQIIVTHFPPVWKKDYWISLSRRHGVDLIIAGHEHKLDIHNFGAENFMKPTAWIVSGGGGGITSEGFPDPQGFDDQYGFHELTLSKDLIEIQAISHGGIVRDVQFVSPVPRGENATKATSNATKNATVHGKHHGKTKKEKKDKEEEKKEEKSKPWFFFKK